MRTKAVFLDAAGVLLDTGVMPAQWQRAVGLHLAPRLGGTPEAWAAANTVALAAWTARVAEAAKKAGPRKGARQAQLDARTRWFTDLCAAAGVPVPLDAEPMAEDVHRACAGQVHAPLGDAVAGVRALREAGLTLFTSTGQPSWEIGAYLRSLGVHELFDRTYGCDLVDRWKTGPHYYRAIAQDADVDPRACIAVDDTPVVLDWAKQAGMRTYLLGWEGGGQRHERIASLTELVALS